MSDVGNVCMVIARKRHRCEMCYGPIPKGELHAYMHGKYDGEWQNWHAHKECQDAADADGDYEFMPGSFEMPARMVELMGQGRVV